MKSIGLIELPNITDAIQALDVMMKTAEVKFLTWEKKLGGRLVTIIVQGEVSAVTEAVEAAKKNAVGNIVASAVIANPHEETMKLVAVSARKYAFLQEKGMSYHPAADQAHRASCPVHDACLGF